MTPPSDAPSLSPSPPSATSPLSLPPTPTSPTPPAPPALLHLHLHPSALPIPTYHPPDPSKKSHAKRQPLGHVPRPRNAFILFRCDFVRQKKVPADVENDHRNISRIAGGVWRTMREEERRPWVEMAEKEKERHGREYPGYRYTPGTASLGLGSGLEGKGKGKGRKKKRGDVREEEMREMEMEMERVESEKKETPRPVNVRAVRGLPPFKRVPSETLHPDASLPAYPPTPPTQRQHQPRPHPPAPSPSPTSYIDVRRSSSCPPGAPRVPPTSPTRESTVPTALLITRDDLARRPSRITMYQSTSSSSSCSTSVLPFPAAPSSTSLLPAKPGPEPAHAPINPPPPSLAHLSPASVALFEHQHQAFNPHIPGPVRDVRPELRTGAYVLDPPRGALGWECAPARPVDLTASAYDWEEEEWGGGQQKMVLLDDSDMDVSTHTHTHTSTCTQAYALTDAMTDNAGEMHHVLPPLPRRPLPTFTNPFAAASTSTSTSPTASIASAPSPTATPRSASGSDTDSLAPGAFSTPSLLSAFSVGVSPRDEKKGERGEEHGFVRGFARMSLDEGCPSSARRE
ncbi:hypothetical protein LshimejAT787_0600310 [Lyophyllum shimeji]|uniref:HMG box domain-containing protein n=1 Tax=Lyophyllum shimeji TaxID=47721 RepID=A0A9P3PNV2_LYOSH|nr:hypothetical protein LshimejAT787_0600310 [Lyophyllum shimeji]